MGAKESEMAMKLIIDWEYTDDIVSEIRLWREIFQALGAEAQHRDSFLEDILFENTSIASIHHREKLFDEGADEAEWYYERQEQLYLAEEFLSSRSEELLAKAIPIFAEHWFYDEHPQGQYPASEPQSRTVINYTGRTDRYLRRKLKLQK